MPDVTEFDHYLADDGPSALVIREYLMPVEGTDAVLFPPTYAAGDNFRGGYNIDPDPKGTNVLLRIARAADGQEGYKIDANPEGRNVCLIDSVGAQANRIEPLFKDEKYKHLVPRIVVKAGDQEVNLLEAGHRAGDAIVRCSALQKEFQDAFRASQNGDAGPLAKIAPTSLVFGVWDSRDTQEKRPRLVASTIRAFDVRELTRSAQYNPPVDYSALDVFTADEKATAEGDAKSPLAKRGFVHHPASGSHGGVIATGGIRRDATLNLVALRLLFAGKEPVKTQLLRRYILGLALTAFTHNPSGSLRQGCLLVLDPSKRREFVEVYPSGERKPVTTTHDEALKYATLVAKEFGVGDDRTVPFEKERAKIDVKGEGDTKTKPKKGSKKGAAAEETDVK
jgi:CRISPR-associated protein Csb1